MCEKAVEFEKLLQFFTTVGNLKKVKRTGWVLKQVRDPESVAGHMYRMAMMAFFADEPMLDRNRCIKVALVHDLAESIVGDITQFDGISKEEKHKMEREAMDQMCGLIPDTSSEEILALYKEYEEQKTPEAKYVKDLDRFDMILQAHEYEQEEKQPGRLQEFFDSTEGMFQHSQVKQWVEALYRMRNQALKDSSS